MSLTVNGKTISVEMEHGFQMFEEFFQAFKVLMVGATFSEETFYHCVKQLMEEHSLSANEEEWN